MVKRDRVGGAVAASSCSVAKPAVDAARDMALSYACAIMP